LLTIFFPVSPYIVNCLVDVWVHFPFLVDCLLNSFVGPKVRLSVLFKEVGAPALSVICSIEAWPIVSLLVVLILVLECWIW
jgi:hypothetical protein